MDFFDFQIKSKNVVKLEKNWNKNARNMKNGWKSAHNGQTVQNPV